MFFFHIDRLDDFCERTDHWKNGGYHYNKAIWLFTTKDQDDRMIKDMKDLKRAAELKGNQYSLGSNNCLTQPANILSNGNKNELNIPSIFNVSDFQAVLGPTRKGKNPDLRGVRPKDFYSTIARDKWFEKDKTGIAIAWPPGVETEKFLQDFLSKFPADHAVRQWAKDRHDALNFQRICPVEDEEFNGRGGGYSNDKK